MSIDNKIILPKQLNLTRRAIFSCLLVLSGFSGFIPSGCGEGLRLLRRMGIGVPRGWSPLTQLGYRVDCWVPSCKPPPALGLPENSSRTWSAFAEVTACFLSLQASRQEGREGGSEGAKRLRIRGGRSQAPRALCTHRGLHRKRRPSGSRLSPLGCVSGNLLRQRSMQMSQHAPKTPRRRLRTNRSSSSFLSSYPLCVGPSGGEGGREEVGASVPPSPLH